MFPEQLKQDIYLVIRTEMEIESRLQYPIKPRNIYIRDDHSYWAQNRETKLYQLTKEKKNGEDLNDVGRKQKSNKV